MRKYIKQYKEGGMETLQEIKFRRQKSELAKHEKTIREYFEKHPAASLPQASEAISQLTEIKRSPVRVSIYRKKA